MSLSEEDDTEVMVPDEQEFEEEHRARMENMLAFNKQFRRTVAAKEEAKESNKKARLRIRTGLSSGTEGIVTSPD